MSKFRTLILALLHLGAGAAPANAAGSGSIPTLSSTDASFTSGVGHLTHGHATVVFTLAPFPASIIPAT